MTRTKRAPRRQALGEPLGGKTCGDGDEQRARLGAGISCDIADVVENARHDLRLDGKHDDVGGSASLASAMHVTP